MEVYTKLAVLLYSDSFTEEDAAILARLDEHGPTRWPELAQTIDILKLVKQSW